MVTPEQAGERFLAVFHRMHRAADERMSACDVLFFSTCLTAVP